MRHMTAENRQGVTPVDFTRRRFLQASLLVPVALVVAACGEAKQDAAPAAEDSEAPTAEVTAAPAASLAAEDLSAKSPFGIASRISSPRLDSNERKKQLDIIKNGGYTWVRFDIRAADIETSGFEPNDDIIYEINKRGLKAMPALVQWWDDPHHLFIETPEEYAAFVGNTVSHYAAEGDISVGDFQLWNEPNEGLFTGGDPDVQRFVQFLVPGYQAGKQANERAVFTSGGLSPDGAGGTEKWLNDMYRLGARDSFDEAGVHLYYAPNPPTRRLENLNKVFLSKW